MDPQTIDTYNKRAKEYDEETIDFWDQFPRTFLDKFIELSGHTVANIGSGPGKDGLLLKDAGKEVTCVDASEAMIALSIARGLTSIKATADDLPFDDQLFDAVWSYTTLLHIPKKDIGASLAEIARVIKPQGIFALGLIEGQTESYKQSSGVDLPRLFTLFTKDEVIELCGQHGFDLVYFDTFKPASKNYLNFIFKKVC